MQENEFNFLSEQCTDSDFPSDGIKQTHFKTVHGKSFGYIVALTLSFSYPVWMDILLKFV